FSFHGGRVAYANRFLRAEAYAHANVNVTRLGDRFLALGEAPVAVEFDPRTLATVGPFPLAAVVPGQLSSPHPQYDAGRRALVNLTTAMGHPGRYHVWTVADGST